MTDFEKVKQYYNKFDEKNRLINDNSGKLEFEMTMRILKSYLNKKYKILDLGGGAGAYSFPLAKMLNKVTLADLSPKLIEEARNKKDLEKVDNLISCDIENAINLSYENDTFDVVLLFGPLYHLLDEDEREKCINEIYRVLKNGGLIFASFIPYLSGSIAIIDRYFRHNEQVNVDNLNKVFETGKFNNNSLSGFQEGYYPTLDEIKKLFSKNGFEQIDMLSIRGIGYEKEDSLYNIKDKEMFNKIIEIIEKTSRKEEIISMCGHAMYIGRKITIESSNLQR